jgi:hypothetical protein
MSVEKYSTRHTHIAKTVHWIQTQLFHRKEFKDVKKEFKDEKKEFKDVQTSFQCFESCVLPSISLREFAERFLKHGIMSTEAMTRSVLYLQRIQERYELPLSLLNIHRLFTVSLLVAAKFCDDDYHNNKHFAKMGSIRLEEINSLERFFLSQMNYDLHCTEHEFSKLHEQIQNSNLIPSNPK